MKHRHTPSHRARSVRLKELAVLILLGLVLGLVTGAWVLAKSEPVETVQPCEAAVSGNYTIEV